MNSLPPRVPRKHSRRKLALRVVRSVRDHPANAGSPSAAVARSLGWQVRKRVGKGDVRIDAYGFNLELPRRSGSLSNYFYYGEAFEWENINLVRAYLRPGDAVADVGANVGMFTYAAAQVVGADGAVHSFEPLPWAAASIRHNLERNHLGHVVLHQMAASDRPGLANFTSDLDVSSHFQWGSAQSASTTAVSVPTASLDDELDDGVELALAKIDVEGAEALALAGFGRHLAAQNPPVIIIEAHDHSLRRMGSSKAEVIDVLAAAGYELLAFDVKSGLLVSVPRGHGADVVAVARRHRAAVDQRLLQTRTR